MNKFNFVKGFPKKCTGLLRSYKSLVPTLAKLRSPIKYRNDVTLPVRLKSGSVKYQQSTSHIPHTTKPPGEERSLYEQFRSLGDTYTSAQAKDVTWDTNVNLAPPSCWKGKPPPEDDHLLSYYNSLQYTLFETGYPETIDRTGSPRTQHSSSHVAVALLASPFECVGILLEGGRQLPDSFHLILSPTWLTQSPSRTNPKINELFIHKAITFGYNGVSYIDEFETPRRVTYFMNFFTEAVTGGQRSDGTQFEQHLGCPIISSIPLANLIDDRLWTRRKMAEVGMATPMTLGLMFKPTWRPPHQDEHAITFKDVTDKDISEVAHIDVVAFLTKLRANGFEKVVVKPSGPKFYGSIGVSIHPIDDVEDIQRKTLSLLEEIEPANSVLIESFQETFAPVPTDKRPQWSADETLGFRIKVTVCRDFTNRPITSKITCVLGPKDSPINGDNGVSQTLDSTLIAFGVLDAYERRLLCANVCRQAEDVLKRIIDTEKHEFSENDLLPGAQTDLIGIDMVITRQNGVLTPVGIEVNSYDCTINCQISEFMSSLYRRLLPVQNMPTHSIELRNSSLEKDYVINDSRFLNIENLMEFKGEGSSVRPLVETMIYRSQQHEMRGKKVVVIGAGGYSKRKLWADAAKYGIEVTLIDSNKDHFAKDLVNRFIHYDLDDHKQDQTHAQNISNVLRDLNIHVDGCVTFWEDCVPLAALVCEILGLNGSTIAAARTAKKKSRTQLAVAANNEDIPHWPRPYLYSSNVHCLSDSESNDSRISRTEFPAILKLEHGSSAVGVSLVKNNYELRKKSTEISETLRSESDYAGIGLGHDNSMFVSDYHEGSEHDVDLVMFGRRPIAAFISDNGPTRVPLFTETAAMMPSSLPLDKQAQLVTAAVQCCTEIGMSDGTFNVELKMTSTGPKLIEINARMGGFYLREWIYNLYGVDIMLSSFMIACGIQPFIPKRNPNKFRMGIMLLPSLHGKLLYDDSFKNWLWENQQKEDIMWTQFAETAQSEHDIHEEPIGNLSVEGRTPDEAKHKLLDICKKFDIETKDYCVHDFLKYF